MGQWQIRNFMIMRIHLLSCLLICYLNVNAQLQEAVVSDTSIVITSIYELDTSYSLKTIYRKGEWQIYYDDAHKQKAYYIKYIGYSYISIEWYRNGQKKIEWPTPVKEHGCIEMTEWYPDGKIKGSARCYEDSCVMLGYYPNGQISTKGINSHDSIRRYMYHYSVEYYENGQLKYDPIDPNGKRQTITGYYKSGARRSQNDIWQGAQVGPYKEWFENGQLKIDGNYEVPTETEHHNVMGNKQTGKWTYYDETGKKIKEGFYEVNKLINTITY